MLPTDGPDCVADGGFHAEDAALDLATVVLECVVQMDHGGVGGGIRLAIADRAVDRVVFLDRFGGVSADSADADDAGLPLQPTRFTYGGDEEGVV